ncbi:MAG: GDSL-type esterase/lipase family protein [Nitrospirales bacterium]
MWFRAFLISWALFFTAILLWMATHKSSDPTILGRYSASYFIFLIGITGSVLLLVSAQFSPIYPYLHKRKENIILFVSSILVSMTLTEVGIRMMDPFGISYLEETNKYHLDKIPDDSLIYKHQPGLKKVYQKVEVTTNEMGLRERSLQKKQMGELRLLLLGDSITFGWGVPEEHTFSRKLEAILRMKLDRNVTTINSGVGSYNTLQEYNFLQHYFDTLQPDMISLLYNSNDIQPVDLPFDPWSKKSFRGKSPPETINLLLRKIWLCRLFIYYPLELAAYTQATEAHSVDTRSVGRNQSMSYLQKMARFCRDRNIPFAIFYYQGIGGMTKLDHSLFTEITGIGKNFGFHVFKVKAYHTESEIPAIINSKIDPHPNRYGHQNLADTMATRLLEYGLIPL